MDINDYNTRLAQTRNRFNEASQELKDNYDKKVADLENLHESREANQRNNYIQQKNDAEFESAKRIKRYDKSLQQELDNRTNRYMTDLSEEKERFDYDRKRQMNDYNQKLSSISKSFETASKEKDKLHALFKDNMNERYDDGLANREKHFNESLRDIQKGSIKALNEYRDQTNDEKRMMITNYDNEKKALVQDATIARNKANSSHQIEMERLRENTKQREQTLRNNFESANANLRKNKDNEILDQRDTFERLTGDVQERNVEALKKLNRENKAEKRQLEKGFANDRIALERKTNSIINEGQLSKVDDAAKGLKERHEAQIANLRSTIEENNYRNSIQNERVSKEHSAEIKKNEIRHNTQLDQKSRDLRNLRENELGKMKEKLSGYQEMMNKRESASEIESEKNAIESKQKMTNALERQRLEFGRTVNQINQSNVDALSDMQDELAKEKTTFIEKTKTDTHNEIAELKNDYDKKFEKNVGSYEQRLAAKEKENMKLVASYEKKIDVLTKKSAKELEQFKRLERERRIEDHRANQREMEARERDFKKQMMTMRREYDRRLDLNKANTDLHIAKLTERYETQLDTERTEHFKEMQREQARMKAEFERVVDQNKIEKNNMVNQYELKLNKLREANRVANELQNSRQDIS